MGSFYRGVCVTLGVDGYGKSTVSYFVRILTKWDRVSAEILDHHARLIKFS